MITATVGSRGPKAGNVQPRFWSKVAKSVEPDACWLWKKPNASGYGMMNIKIGDHWTQRAAHRLAWEFTKGEIPKGLTVDHRHTCPKACVNPQHLRLCTIKQNLENQSTRPRKNNTSGARGVYWHKLSGLWRASVKHNGKECSAGYYKTVEEAAEAARLKRIELFTHNDADRV